MYRSKYCSLIGMLTVWACFGVSEAQIDYNMPIREADDDAIVYLEGLDWDPKFKHYSGYLDGGLDPSRGKFLHYWFVESQSNPENDPLIIWLGSGEIGCSNMIGLLAEIGPFEVTSDLKLKSNPYSWNKHANLLFMDSPAGVGYSYRLDKNMYSNDDTIAQQDYMAVKSFLQKFPSLRENPMYLTGRFWAGIHLPLLGLHLDADDEINLKGIAIGNGYLDMANNDVAMLFNGYYHGILSELAWENLAAKCCSRGLSPSKEHCQFWPPESGVCEIAIAEAAKQIFNSGLNIYNVNKPCTGDNRPMINNATMASMFGRFDNIIGLSRSIGKGDTLTSDPICISYEALHNYLNLESVRTALHIPEEVGHHLSCNPIVTSRYQMIYPFGPGGLSPQVRQLLDSKRKLNMIFYSGDADLTCPLIGSRWFVDNLDSTSDGDHNPWYVDDQVAGFRKQFEQVSFMTIRGAGQMVASDRPREALELLEKYLLQL